MGFIRQILNERFAAQAEAARVYSRVCLSSFVFSDQDVIVRRRGVGEGELKVAAQNLVRDYEDFQKRVHHKTRRMLDEEMTVAKINYEKAKNYLR